MKRHWIVAPALLFGAILTPTESAGAAQRSSCEVIVAELREQGASQQLAHWLGRRVAWRESGCRAVYVRDHDDWSYSRFGLNGRTRNLRRYWQRLCGADVRYDTQALSVDVRCALAAYEQLGARPWN